MHKKLHLIFIMVCLCFAMFFTVSADNINTVSLIAEDASGVVGSEVIVRILAENCNTLSAGSFNICFDETSLELVDCKKGDVFGNMSPNINKKYAVGKVRVSWMATTSIDEGVLFEITFKAVKSCETAVRLENVKLGNIYADTLSYSVSAATVSVISNEPTVDLGNIYVTSADKAVLRIYNGEYEYSIEELTYSTKKIYMAEYDSERRLSLFTALQKEKTAVAVNDIDIYRRFFVWNDKMSPLRKDVEIHADGTVKGLITEGSNSISAEILNTSSNTKDVAVRVIVYSDDGSVLDTAEEISSFESGKSDTLNVNFNIPDGCSYVKVSVLEDNILPLCESFVLDV